MYRYAVRPDAIAQIRGGEGAPELSGTVRFYQKCGSVLVAVTVSGLPREGTGFFALHIHEGRSCGGENFEETGGHYNPTGAEHPCHAGDLPPLLRRNDGAYLAVETDRFSVRDVIGHTVVIHSGSDDFHSQPAGNAGSKLACGVICQH